MEAAHRLFSFNCDRSLLFNAFAMTAALVAAYKTFFIGLLHHDALFTFSADFDRLVVYGKIAVRKARAAPKGLALLLGKALY